MSLHALESRVTRDGCDPVKKQHLLEDRTRTTSQNGGVALGRERFFQETGIKESDWLGKYWARWSDAVKEAGCVPRQMQAPMREESLIEHLIALIRELGHLPVVAELKLNAKRSPGFPSPNTIRRLGTKSQQVRKSWAASLVRPPDACLNPAKKAAKYGLQPSSGGVRSALPAGSCVVSGDVSKPAKQAAIMDV